MIFILFVMSYLIGSVPFALVVGKVFFQKDIRTSGSGNLGATNSFRVLGKKAGTVVMIGDVLKGTLASSLPFLLHIDVNPIWVGIAAIIGHCYPVFANFKGGKAVATTAGVLLYAFPVVFLISLIIFIITLKLFKYVSLSSIFASLSVFIYSLVQMNVSLILFSSIICVFILYKHRTNILRIRNQTEPKVKWI